LLYEPNMNFMSSVLKAVLKDRTASTACAGEHNLRAIPSFPYRSRKATAVPYEPVVHGKGVSGKDTLSFEH